MNVDTLHAIETFLAGTEGERVRAGVSEAPSIPYTFCPPPKPKLSAEERALVLRELKELAEAYKCLPRVSDMTEDEILGYDENGLPT